MQSRPIDTVAILLFLLDKRHAELQLAQSGRRGSVQTLIRLIQYLCDNQRIRVEKMLFYGALLTDCPLYQTSPC